MKMAPSDITLVGFNIPNEMLFDGNFDDKGYPGWRLHTQSDSWVGKVIDGHFPMGLSGDKLSSGGNKVVTYTSIREVAKKFASGDIVKWRLAAQTEYVCDGYVSLSLICEEKEILLSDKIKVPNAPDPAKEYGGEYSVEDTQLTNPRLKITMYSDFDINVYVEWIDLYLTESSNTANKPRWGIVPEEVANGIALVFNQEMPCDIYRSTKKRKGYKKIASNCTNVYVDHSAIPGQFYYYCIKLSDFPDSTSSYVVKAIKRDEGISIAPTNLRVQASDYEVTLTWTDGNEDTEFYNIYRADNLSSKLSLLHHHFKKGTTFIDTLPIKGSLNIYAITAIDFSGTESPLSEIAIASVSAIFGSSFSDLIKPLPANHLISTGIWGADYVLPRDTNNGIEDNEYSYWGGRIVQENNKYHLNIVRWPESSRKGHWAWPLSTTAYAVADNPMGPYSIVRDKAYTYANQEDIADNLDSLGHNTNIILRSDGTYYMYTLVNFIPIILSSNSISGPWKYEGKMIINHNDSPRAYRYERNLSGLELEDGSFLFASKAGNMIKSANGILGPYEVCTKTIQENLTIPEKYRNSVYEDPVIWKDEVQFHMIINAFIDFRAIYLRSADGLNWVYEDGFAYTPNSIVYQNGVRNLWHKIERPNVLVDHFGRATHLSMAVIDIDKDLDYPNDNHSSKNQVLELTVPRRLKRISSDEILILNEENDTNDFNISSFIFGSPKSVNYGKGAKVIFADICEEGVILKFEGETHLTNDPSDFAAKLIGKTSKGDLVIGYILNE
ncbi:MAG: hypothetical protein ATN31_11270 [Candidatus Epulonipiscioides saccharophilum]|nr:MAG: hypothetical protein ATN31_11270 [Epulopiscium sp. AS2M-Bin001]